MSNAIDGTNYGTCRSFAFAFNAAGGASVSASIAAGSYYLVAASGDALVVLGSSPTAAALPSTQPAADSPNGHIYVPAGVAIPLDVSASTSIAALGATSTAGTLNVIGPIGRSSNP